MAGITNAAFRRLCREHGAGLYVSEMITARALLERDDETLRMITFAAEEHPRSVQLYGVDAATVAAAVRLVVDEDRADHVDLNFGCPVPKVTRRGGGAALPWKRELFRDVVRGAVAAAAGRVPVTVKMRTGIDDDHLTYLEAGRIAEDAGAAAVALHARTAAQSYSGAADWAAIRRLKEHLGIPVLGNGDVWEAADALRMMRETGCDGVVVGRGCLGRPWLFAALAAVFAGQTDDGAGGAGGAGGASGEPPLAEVAATMRRHAGLLAAELGEDRGVRTFRKHVAWYLKGFLVGADPRARLGQVSSLRELDELLAGLDLDQPFPLHVLNAPRGRAGSPRRVALPDGWLDDPLGRPRLREPAYAVSGG
ncbi:MAG: tRNA dihydrouridine synthase DusB [Actinomycetota bacterium]|nr:tRNA dihydrouridine synthase DusB [Actinomycetota bacterium]